MQTIIQNILIAGAITWVLISATLLISAFKAAINEGDITNLVHKFIGIILTGTGIVLVLFFSLHAKEKEPKNPPQEVPQKDELVEKTF